MLMVAYRWEIYGKNVQVRLCDWPSSLSPAILVSLYRQGNLWNCLQQCERKCNLKAFKIFLLFMDCVSVDLSQIPCNHITGNLWQYSLQSKQNTAVLRIELVFINHWNTKRDDLYLHLIQPHIFNMHLCNVCVLKDHCRYSRSESLYHLSS